METGGLYPPVFLSATQHPEVTDELDRLIKTARTKSQNKKWNFPARGT
jgi:hypothetical protein